MNDAQRRYMHARQAIQAKFIDPAQELLSAASDLVKDAEGRAIAANAELEALRPHWAQGYTSDSIAAQCSFMALSELWFLLGTKDQTSAVARLRDLIVVAETAPANIWSQYAKGTWRPGDTS